MAEQTADYFTRLTPRLSAKPDERIQRGITKHGMRCRLEQPSRFQYRQIKHPITNGDTRARLRLGCGTENAKRQILNGEVALFGDIDERFQCRVIRMHART